MPCMAAQDEQGCDSTQNLDAYKFIRLVRPLKVTSAEELSVIPVKMPLGASRSSNKEWHLAAPAGVTHGPFAAEYQSADVSRQRILKTVASCSSKRKRQS